jgi:putative DNA primase/helicase
MSEVYSTSPVASSAIVGPRPVAPAPCLDAIPAELRGRRQWVCWRYGVKDGRWTKIPRRAAGNANASTTDPATWSTFEAAADAYRHRGKLVPTHPRHLDGIGFVFAPDDPYVGLDFDHCLDDQGNVHAWAAPFLERLVTYAEVSPSGCGIKLVAIGALPGPGSKVNGFGADRTGAIETYDRGRYFTITGWRVPAAPDAPVDLSETIAEMHRELFPPKARTSKPSKAASKPVAGLPDDDVLIDLARKMNHAFSPLFDQGDTTANGGDHSAADYALCGLLAFWFGRDPVAVDRVFRRSALMRDKWDERHGAMTYGEMTVANAIEAQETVWEPRPQFSDGVPGNGRAGTKERQKNPSAAGPEHQGETGVEPERFPLTDLGNGERLAHRHGRDLRYVHPWKKWLVWDGRRWKEDNTAAVARKAKDTVRAIYREAAAIDDDSLRAAVAKWGRESEKRDRVNAMMALAANELPALPEDLDRDPWALNVRNGVIDLRSGELRPHRREDFLCRLAPVEYDQAADCPLWLATLSLVFNGDQELIGFVRRLFGVALTGTVREQVLPIFHGAGSNGKSTILNTLLGVLGTDYGMKAPKDLLMLKRNEAHPTELATLHGKRLIVAIETAGGARLNESLIKELTGSDPITTRRMREDFWTFDPTHKVILATNHRPKVRGTDHAIWRRLKLVPFDVTIPDDQADRTVPERLRAEYPGILAWAVRGCLEWQETGLRPPGTVDTATTAYRTSQDVVGQFLTECCTVDPADRVKASELFGAYRAWSERGAMKVMTQNDFGADMTERGFERFTNNGTYYRGIGLRATQ